MSYIDRNYHISSIVRVNARNTGGGYRVIVTNAESAHFIKANVGHDGWPTITGKTVNDPFHRSFFTKTGGTTYCNVGSFIYLKNGQLSFICCYIKDNVLDSESLQDIATAFSVTQLSEDDEEIRGFPLVLSQRVFDLFSNGC
jgi:hypothetical protein